MRALRLYWIALSFGALALGCTDYNSVASIPIVPVGPPMTGLHVSGNHLENAQGDTVILRGVNRSGTEYQCVHSGSVFDGAWGAIAVAAIASWKANAVRIPLNESCWLTGNSSNDTYKQSIRLFVDSLRQFHIAPILELHWVGPGTTSANGQQPMPDVDHAVDFWKDVAATYANDDDVVLELYNEPFPGGNKDSDAAWACWRDGCTETLWASQVNASGATVWGSTQNTYQAVGMQALVDAIRPIAPKNLILLGGVRYSNSLSQWMAHAPADPNLAPAWHVYNFNPCVSAACWDGAPGAIAVNLPLIVTEIGEDDCAGGFIEPFMQWLDGKGASYLAWSWNASPACIPGRGAGGRPWQMVTDYNSGTPSGAYAQAFHDHLAAVVGSPATSP